MPASDPASPTSPVPATQPPAWILPGRAYPGWAWMVATACLWLLFAGLMVLLGETQREFEHGSVSNISLRYYGTALAAVVVAACAFLRRRWAWQLSLVTSAPMLLVLPVGTLCAALGMRALWRSRAWFEESRS